MMKIKTVFATLLWKEILQNCFVYWPRRYMERYTDDGKEMRKMLWEQYESKLIDNPNEILRHSAASAMYISDTILAPPHFEKQLAQVPYTASGRDS